MAIKIYPYKQGSASAKTLANTLEGKVLKLQGSKYKPRRGDTVVNWGASNVPRFGDAKILNADVSKAQCKLASFQALEEEVVRTPEWTTSRAEAGEWIDEGKIVVCRTKLRGHSGDGIVLASTREELVKAPLYTQYVKKKDEYRVHVMGGETFFVQRKARKLDVENPDWKIRNLAGGFVFVEVEIGEVPADVLGQAEDALLALGLDFGGVDVIWNENEEKAYVLEVNTACGLEQRTAENYRDALLDYIQD